MGKAKLIEMVAAITNKMFLHRNEIQQISLKNRHTFEEKLYLDADSNSLVVEVIIGGNRLGVIMYKYVYEADLFFDLLNELYEDLIAEYNKNYKNIDPNLNITTN